MESFSTNVPIVREDLLKAFCRLFYLQFVLQVISEKTLYSKGFTSNLRDIFPWNNRNYDSYRFSYKFGFIPFFSFLPNLKQESESQQVAGLVTRNIYVFLFIASCALPQRDFYKGILLHVIPVRIIVPWSYRISLIQASLFNLSSADSLFPWQCL